MCFDPASLLTGATALGGAALSSAGAASNAKAQAQTSEATALDNVLRANASNAVLSKFSQEQQGNENTNQATLQPEYASLNPAAFQASRAQIGQTNGANDVGAIKAGLNTNAAGMSPTSQQVGLTGTDPNVAATIANRTNTLVGQQQMNAQNRGNLAAYGQNFANLGLQESAANRGIDETNNQARSQAGILPTDEQNAALQASIFIPGANTTNGSTEEGLGNLLSSNAKGIGSALNSGANSLGSVFQSWMNPTLGATTYSGGGMGMQ